MNTPEAAREGRLQLMGDSPHSGGFPLISGSNLLLFPRVAARSEAVLLTAGGTHRVRERVRTCLKRVLHPGTRYQIPMEIEAVGFEQQNHEITGFRPVSSDFGSDFRDFTT